MTMKTVFNTSQSVNQSINESINQSTVLVHCFFPSALLVAVLDLKAVSARQCISFGTGLACLGYLLAACVPSVDLLIVSLGVGLGK